jgi:hypothetical protein
MQLKTLRNRSSLSIIVPILISYLSVYGTIAIFIDSITVRSIKDIILISLVAYAMINIFFKEKNKVFIYILLLILIFVVIIGLLGLILTGKVVAWIYGFKVTILPMCLIFLGYFLSKKSIGNFEKTYCYIFILMLVAWVVQYKLGVTQLIAIGYEYGLNIKHFVGGMPRLPSIVGYPDGYAFLLAIFGILVERAKFLSRNLNFQWGVRFLTFIFLLVSTIRAAILLWVVCQTVLFLLNYKTFSRNSLTLALSFIFFIILGFISILYINLLSRDFNISIHLLSINSLLIRFGHWGDNLPSLFSIHGLLGYGLGMVGAASRRIADLGHTSADYAVDNQFFAFYEQFGLIGFSLIMIFLIIILYQLFKRYINFNDNDTPVTSIALIIGTLFSGFFANTLEIYPFNVVLWLFIGMSLTRKQIQSTP